MKKLNELLGLASLVFTSNLLLGAAVPASGPLTLDLYLKEVQEKHEGIKALEETSSGALLRADEGNLLVRPSIFANIQISNDKKPTSNPAFLGNETAFDGYSFGVMEQTNFGMNAKLSYSLNYTRINGAQPAFLPVPIFYEARPVLELTQSLLRNGFGRETRSTVLLADASARAQGLLDRFKIKSMLAEAEGTYWSLALARELVQVQAESVERAKKIREWNAKRARLELADKADLLQSDAGLQGRTLEYQAALDDLAATERSFNRMRGSEALHVDEKLSPLDKDALEEVAVPEKKGKRGDVLAYEKLAQVAEASAQLGKEKNLPNLDLYGTVALNGRDKEFSNATSDSLKTQFPTLGVGVKFSSPLDFWTTSSDREGYAKEQKASELNYRRKLWEEQLDWKELVTRLEEAKRRLKMTNSIEVAQNEKLVHERERLKRGRSVTFQVITFEQDFATAQAMRIRTEAEILRILAQLKLFGEK